jgi:hypothetical protein
VENKVPPGGQAIPRVRVTKPLISWPSAAYRAGNEKFHNVREGPGAVGRRMTPDLDIPDL